MVQKILPAEIITQNAAFAVVMFLGTGAMRISTTAPTAARGWMEGPKVNESAADWGLVFDTLLLIAFLQSDAETPEAAAEKFAKKLLDIPENVDLFAETPEERRARSDKWYAQEWEKIKQEIEEMKISEDTMRQGNPALG